MNIILSIPQEWEEEFANDRLADCFDRVITDLCHNQCLTGNYEFETLYMLREALHDATIINESDATRACKDYCRRDAHNETD